MAEQYDVSPEQRRLLIDRAKRRAVLREEFLKQSTDPFRHALNEGGTVFDPAIQRFMSMKVTQFEHFKPTPKTTIYGILGFVLPLTLFGYFTHKSRRAREAQFRNGEVAYKDRLFKFV